MGEFVCACPLRGLETVLTIFRLIGGLTRYQKVGAPPERHALRYARCTLAIN
jgi:hypothetical protein